MFSRHESHHGNRKERQFEKRKRVSKKVKAAEHRGYQRGVQQERARARAEAREKAIYVETQKRQQENISGNNATKKQDSIEWIKCLFIFLLFILVIAWIYKGIKGIFDNLYIFWFGGLLLFFVKTIWGAVASDRQLGKNTRGNRKLFQAALAGVKDIWKNIMKNNMSILLLLIIICLLLGGTIGQFEVVSRFGSACKAFGKTFLDYHSEEIKKNANVEENEMNQESDITQSSNVPQLDESDAQSVPSAGTMPDGTVNVILADEVSTNELNRIKISDSEIENILVLSSEDRNNVFFLSGKYAIEEWENQQHVDDQVSKMIKDTCNSGKTNKFDGVAPQSICDKIAAVSKLEENVSSFSEIQRIMTTREEVYDSYPKQSLANLISNGEQLQALVLDHNNAQQETIMYHYAQSVLWNFEYLRYKTVSKSTIKRMLTIIAERYQDIIYSCSDCREVEYAQKLRIAFEHAADQY